MDSLARVSWPPESAWPGLKVPFGVALYGGRASQKAWICDCSCVVSAVGALRNVSRKLCIPLAPAKSGRVSRSMNCVIFLALLTIETAFFVRTS